MHLKIDRMEIDEVGGDPIRLADAILRQLPDLSMPIPVREIAAAIDIYEIREEPLDGLEGALIVQRTKSEGAILVRNDRHETRKRYTIAHEIGHYVNPFHVANSPDGFRCGAADMVKDFSDAKDKASKMEAQANQFAAELLMPRREVDKFLRAKRAADICDILEMATRRFNVSKEAAARRYVERFHEPMAVLFSHDGKVRYVKSHPDFPRLNVWAGQVLPPESVSVTSEKPVGVVTEWNEVAGHLWLTRSSRFTVFEQTLAQANGFRMTLLTVEKDSEEDLDCEPVRFTRQ